MATTKNGTKRSCPACGARFYDLGAQKVVCPKCSHVLPIQPATKKKITAHKQSAVEPVAPKKSLTIDGIDLKAFDVDVSGESLSDLEEVAEIEDLEEMEDFESLDALEELEEHQGDSDVDRDSDDGDDEAFMDAMSSDTAFLDQVDEMDAEHSRSLTG